MTLATLFWTLYLVGIVFFGIRERADLKGWIFDSLFWWLMIFLLGLGTFGSPIK